MFRLPLFGGVVSTPDTDREDKTKASEEKPQQAQASNAVTDEDQKIDATTSSDTIAESQPPAPAPSPPPRIFTARAGSTLGMSHLQKRRNNQDAFLVRTVEAFGKRYLIGLVADGCTGMRKKSEKQQGVSRTEVGATLLTMYAFSEIRQLLSLGVPMTEIPKSLYPRCVGFIGNLARITIAGQPEELASFIGNFCLCTLLGFIMDDSGDQSTLITFASGDGFFAVNDRMIPIDKNDQALYLGYHQVGRQFLGDAALSLPDGFEEVNVYDVAHLNRFAMGTDGLLQRSDSNGLYLDSAEVGELFEYRPSAPAGLQWWLNKAQSERERFSDDTTLITLAWKQVEEKVS